MSSRGLEYLSCYGLCHKIVKMACNNRRVRSMRWVSFQVTNIAI